MICHSVASYLERYKYITWKDSSVENPPYPRRPPGRSTIVHTLQTGKTEFKISFNQQGTVFSCMLFAAVTAKDWELVFNRAIL